MKIRTTGLDIVNWSAFIMFAAGNIILPICLPEISKSLDTNLSQGGGLETARSVIVLVTLILGGLCARKLGKKPFITAAQYLLSAGLLLASFAENYPVLVLSLMIGGIGGGFCEAMINPLVIDIHPENPGKFLNFANAFFSFGILLAALIFGELLTYGIHWRWLFRFTAAGPLLSGFFFNISVFPRAIKHKKTSMKIITGVLASPVFWLFGATMLMGAGVEAAFLFWSRSYTGLYLREIPRAGSLAVVIFAGLMAGGRLLSARLSQYLSLRLLMILSACLGIIVSIIIPFTSNLVLFYILAGLAGIAAACFWPSILAEAAVAIKTETTILFMMLACIGIGGFALVPWLMGFIGDRVNLRAGFLIIPGLFLLLILIFSSEWIIRYKSKTRQHENEASGKDR